MVFFQLSSDYSWFEKKTVENDRRISNEMKLMFVLSNELLSFFSLLVSALIKKM
jgi:hypothetical protein